MSLEGLAAVGLVCACIVVVLVLVLRHLKSLHLTKTQADGLGLEITTGFRAIVQTIEPIARDLEDLKQKHTALSNRVR